LQCLCDFPLKRKFGKPVDTQTRHALKQDRFVTATTSGLDWVGQNRASVIRWSIAAVVALAVVIAGVVLFEQRSAAADQLLGQGLTVYETPIASPDQPTPPGDSTYASAKDRAKAAYPIFAQAASQYSWLHAGHMARYFAGLTAQDMGNTSEAESDLRQVAGSGGNIGATAKVALANLYAQTGRTSQAVEEFRDLIAHPAATVPKASAQLMLAQLYETTQPEEARRIYAQIKDQDKDSEAAQIATQKLSGAK
jgi:tetratricopeptide (TPR) repeat protein